MVRAFCTTGPCNPFFTLRGGSTLIKRAKQPKLVTNRKFGRVSIYGLEPLGGVPVPSTLEAQVSGTRNYGADVDGGAACLLSGSSVSGLFATSTMTCTVRADGIASCRGDLFFVDSTPSECSDVDLTVHDLSVEVYEGGFVGTPERLIGTGGMHIMGKAPDCASGGSGCP